MAHKHGKTRGPRQAGTRLSRADRFLEQAWDVLDPEDISADRWEDLRKLILAVKAARKRL